MLHWSSLSTLVKLTCLWIIILGAHPAVAQEFNMPQANELLNDLSDVSQAPSDSRSVQELQEAGTRLIDYRNEARLCVEVAKKNLEDIKGMMPVNAVEETLMSEDQIYIKNKKKSLEKRIAECQLFILKSEETLKSLNEQSIAVTTTQLFARGPNLMDQLRQTPPAFQQFIQTFKGTDLLASLGLDHLKWSDTLLFLAIGAFIALWINKLRMVMLAWIQEHDLKSWPDQINQTLLSVAYRYLVPLVLLVYATLFFGLYSLNQAQVYTTLELCLYALGFILILFFIDFLFAPPTPAKPFCHISDEYSIKFSFALKKLTTIIFLGLLSIEFFKTQSANLDLVYITRSIFFTLTALGAFYILLMLNRMPQFLAQIKKIRAIMSFACFLILVTILVAEWWGYQSFSAYLLIGVLLTAVASFLTWFVHHLTQAFLSSFGENKYPWQQSFHAFLGVEKQGSLPEMIGLKVGLFILIWGSLLISLINIWTIGQTWAYRISDSLSKPWILTNTDISFIPSRVIFGFIAFSLLVLLVRFLRAMIQRKVRTSKDKAEREAYGAIFGYTGFAIAFILALIIAGFDFKSLAIIAGALSVGIGFGLQNIVSNFISGIILLLERPIKPGDRIAIGNEEGFVKKVSIRSTCITTLENVDVIIPNAELISKQVVNQTFNNMLWRVTVNVGVAYGSDVELVKECLYEVASKNSQVFQEGINKPQVFFLEFGESSLNFEMWCIIKNVNMKLLVLSELNSAIDKIFAEKGITIPFPQRDLHIKDSQVIPLDMNKEMKPKDE